MSEQAKWKIVNHGYYGDGRVDLIRSPGGLRFQRIDDSLVAYLTALEARAALGQEMRDSLYSKEQAVHWMHMAEDERRFVTRWDALADTEGGTQ